MVQESVLVVEGNVYAAATIRDALRALSFDFLCVASTDAALDALATRAELSCIIADPELDPEDSGWDLVRCAHILHPGIAIIYGTGEEATHMSPHRLPGTTVINKPFTARDIGRAILNLENIEGETATLPRSSGEAKRMAIFQRRCGGVVQYAADRRMHLMLSDILERRGDYLATLQGPLTFSPR